MTCNKFSFTDGAVKGITCSFTQDRGRILMFEWELNKYFGISWFINYPIFQLKKCKNFFKKRPQYSFIDKLKMFYWWFEIAEKEIIVDKDNPLWSYFYFQQWYRKKFIKKEKIS